MPKMKLFIAIIALVIISGCVLPGGTRAVKVEANTGVKINKFLIDPAVAEEDEVVRFDVEVENVGGVRANNVEIVLSGLEGVWRRLTGELAGPDDVKKVIGSMEPPRPASGVPGDLAAFTVMLKPPDLPEGVQMDFPVTARANYDYKSTGSAVIPTISMSLYREKLRRGDPMEDKPTIGNSFAPLQVGLESTRIPLIVNEAGNKTTETYIIEILNTGTGSPISGGSVGSLTGTIKLLGAGATLKRCLSKNAVSNAVTFTSSDVDLVKLRAGRKLDIPCDLEMAFTTPGATGSITFTVDMDYKYFIEETAVIRLYGK